MINASNRLKPRAKPALMAVILILASAIFIAGCGREYTGFDDSGMPKGADDESVLTQWKDYEILKNVPVYTGGGIFDLIANPSGDAVNVYYNGTSEDDYLEYNSKLTASGYKLAPDSSVWSSEGTFGVPQYIKNDLMVTLVWSVDGTLAICVAYK